MRKGTELINRVVVAYDSGRKLASVKDLIFSQDRSALVALLVSEPGWFSDAKIVPFSHIQAIGADAIVIKSADSILAARQVPAVDLLLDRENILRGTEIITEKGSNLGKMVDLYFDRQTGAVEGYEVSGGIFSDAYSGRSFVPASETIRIGQDFAFVSDNVMALMEEQVGGIKAAITPIQDQAQKMATAVHDKIVPPDQQKKFALGRPVESDVHHPDGSIFLQKHQTIIPSDLERAEELGILDKLYEAAGGSFTEAAKHSVSQKADEIAQATSDKFDQAANQSRDTVAKHTVEETLGHRVRSTVYNQDREIIAATGQIVTVQIIDKARQSNREKALLNATGFSVESAAKHQAGVMADYANTQAHQLGEQVHEGVSSALEWTTQTASEMFDRGVSMVEERRIKHALGRPVNRVILDQQDGIILNVGELVTHQAISDARQSAVLDILLDSVNSNDLTNRRPKHMQQPQIGQAALVSNN